jgi:hypothetical protein
VIKFGRPPAPTAEEFAEWKRRELRDQFAGNALAGMMANIGWPGRDYEPDRVATDAYKYADAMLAEREK